MNIDNNNFDNFFLLAGIKTGFGMNFINNNYNLLYVFIFSTLLFLIGIFGIIVLTYNLILVLMSLEIMLLGLSVDFVIISYYYYNEIGHIFALVILTLAASESAIALAIFINIYKLYRNLDLKKIVKLKN